ncbi:hypothetical protein GCM10018962_02040 [Dactylosporangium matsuzakiense]|uniref:Uncharacterized protein n=1 Tax=Dactylosporangium matsuzakiense TaxID=53360 RepID=A0A9W6KKZ0_9ACTN|nr:hypothetical protein GCM10017581_057540 [Dactylosporangium matsuzakiense]
MRLILLFLHLIGFALLLGGSIAQYLTGKLRISPAMLWGAVIQVVTGLGLAAPLRGGGDHEPPTAKLAVKLVIGLMILAMTFFSRKRDEVNRGHFLALVGLTIVNAAVAVFWR